MKHANLNGYNKILLQYKASKIKYKANQYASNEIFVMYEKREFFSNIYKEQINRKKEKSNRKQAKIIKTDFTEE